ncbi:MAG: type I-E CRISPR-associated protein Cse2/CasB [Candidatus Omnitrophota bacterium]
MRGNTKERLLEFLRKNSEDRAVLANLRCALKETQKHRAWPVLARFGGIDDHTKKYDHEAKVIQTVAGLFGVYSQNDSRRDFGLSCRDLMRDDEKLSDPKDVGPVAKRFQYLLASEREEICDRVIRFVLRMKAQNIAVNYDDLFDGLLYWGDKIKTKWAGSFWNVSGLEEVIG